MRDREDHVVFESGAVRADGSIVGNDNDLDPNKFEPHYGEIHRGDEVQIYEDIIGDANGAVTTGLLNGVRYLKDNRLIPHGFDKKSAGQDIAVIGSAADDPGFTDAGHRIRYKVALGAAQGPFHIEVELWYQPIGYRWANNLKAYAAAEPRRFTNYFDAMSNGAGVILARSETHRP